jgi:hypothetical protein
MSESPLPPKSGTPSTGAIGLVFTILFCIALALAPVGLFALLLGGALGLAGLVISIIGIARKSGRAAGVVGIFVFLLGCLITFTVVLDMIAQVRR